MTTVFQVIQDTVLAGTTAVGVGASAEITIRDAETAALVTLKQDRLGASGETNPFNADANGQFRVYTAPGRLQITVEHDSVTRIWEDFQLENPEQEAKGAVDNFGLTTTIDSPAAGDILLAFKQGDNSSDCTEIAPASFSFSGRKEPLKLEAAATLKLDATNGFGEGDADGVGLALFIYAINRGGTLVFGVGRRRDYTRVTADFVAEGDSVAASIDTIICQSLPTVNDLCYVVGEFYAVYNTTIPDWESVTADSIVASPNPAPALIPKNFISGLVPSNSGVEDISISPGQFVGNAGNRIYELDSTLVKQIDAAWALGTNAGGYGSVAGIADGVTYHLFALGNPVTGAVDAGFDVSLTAATLRGLASGFTEYRRIASIIHGNLTASEIDPFIATEISGGGLDCLLKVPVTDYDVADPGISPVLAPLSIPTGIVLYAHITLSIHNTTPIGADYIVTSPDQTATSPTASLHDGITIAAAIVAQTNKTIRTDTSAQIRFETDASDANFAVRIATFGYTDHRK